MLTSIYDQHTRTDAIVTSVAILIARGGLPAATLRNIAAETRMAQSGLAYDIGNRDRILEVSARRFGMRMVFDLDVFRGPCGLLPEEGGDLLPPRVWLAFRELARFDPRVADAVAEVDQHERNFVARVLEPEGTPVQAETVHLFATALRDAVCRTVRPMPIATALDLMRSHLAAHDLHVHPELCLG